MFPLLDFIGDRMHDDFHNFVTVKAGMQVSGTFLKDGRTCRDIRQRYKTRTATGANHTKLTIINNH